MTPQAQRADAILGALIDLNDGLHDDGGTRAKDARHALSKLHITAGYDAWAWYAVAGLHSILSGPERAEVYECTHHCTLYPPENTEAALYHFVRLINC